MTAPMLTTVDNPYNPFIDFDDWYSFDEQKGYHTCSYLARIAIVSEELTDEEYEMQINEAINEIIDFNLLGIYQKVTPETFDEMKARPLTKEQQESLDLLNSSVVEEES